MKTIFTKQGVLVSLVILLLISNLATILTLLYLSRKEKIHECPMPLMRHEDKTWRMNGRMLRDKLNLTDQQMTEFRHITPLFRKNTHELTMELGEMRRKMFQEMQKKTIDSLRLFQITDSIGIIHTNLKKVSCKYYFNLRNLCTEQQKPMLDTLFKQMFRNGSNEFFPKQRHKRRGGEGN